MKRVYLCGPISGLTYDRAVESRRSLSERFSELGIEALSPMRGKLSYVESRKEIMATRGYKDVMRNDKAIVNRDRNDVMTCDLMFADLMHATRVSIGSMVEFGWADAFRKPIVTLVEEGSLHDHAFVHQLSTYVTDDIEEAVSLTLHLLNTRSK